MLLFARRLLPQPLTAYMVSGLALVALGGAVRASNAAPALSGGASFLLLAVCLGVAVVAADSYPIHIGYHTKAPFTTIPLFLMAALLHAPLAGATAGISLLAADLLHRKQRGNYPSDIATHIGRWVIIVLLGAAIAQQGDRSLARQAALLLAAALAMYATDAVTIGIELAPITGEAPRRAVLAAVRAGGLIEAVQYLLGFVGALAVMQHAFDQAWMLLSLIFPAALVYLLLKRDREMRGSTRSLLEGLADAVDLRDPYTGGHSRRVTDYCAGILKELNLQGPDATLIVTAARVHDIGKIGIPDMVLQKPGALTPDEWAIMQTHSDRGADLLARYPDFARGVAIVRHHHERWDGKGYPAGLKGYDIPFGARLMAVADSFDAMTSDRPYRPGMSVEKATQILHEGRGVQWDAALVDAFLRSIAVTKTLDAETQRLGDAEQETNLTQRRRDAETQKPKEVCA